jgi:hypothetical protein
MWVNRVWPRSEGRQLTLQPDIETYSTPIAARSLNEFTAQRLWCPFAAANTGATTFAASAARTSA